MDGRDLMRHSLAVIAYRAQKALAGAERDFAHYHANRWTRKPVEILAHMGDLFDWALLMAKGRHEWHDSVPLAWEDERARFFASLTAFDEYLASGAPVHGSLERLLQGPVADALTHIGQIAMLRRMAGSAIRGENYYKADIRTGQTSPLQAVAAVEFD